MPRGQIKAVKHGSKEHHTEAFVDTETGRYEDTGWTKGPSNKFVKDCRSDGAGKGDLGRELDKDVFNKNYDKINWDHEKENENGKKA